MIPGRGGVVKFRTTEEPFNPRWGMSQAIGAALLIGLLTGSAGTSQAFTSPPTRPSLEHLAPLVLLNSAGAAAQAAINNAALLQMLKSGIGEAVLLASVNGAETATFDTAPEALIELKAAGATDALLSAILERAARSAVALPEPPASVALVEVPDGTEIRLRLLTPMSSATARVEDSLRFEVIEDVSVNGVVVVSKGAEAIGRVTEAKKSGSFGRGGKLAFSVDRVSAADGSAVPIRSNRELKGDARVGGTVAAVALVGVFGGFVKGKNIDAPVGSEYTVFTQGVRSVKTPKRLN